MPGWSDSIWSGLIHSHHYTHQAPSWWEMRWATLPPAPIWNQPQLTWPLIKISRSSSRGRTISSASISQISHGACETAPSCMVNNQHVSLWCDCQHAICYSVGDSHFSMLKSLLIVTFAFAVLGTPKEDNYKISFSGFLEAASWWASWTSSFYKASAYNEHYRFAVCLAMWSLI